MEINLYNNNNNNIKIIIYMITLILIKEINKIFNLGKILDLKEIEIIKFKI